MGTIAQHVNVCLTNAILSFRLYLVNRIFHSQDIQWKQWKVQRRKEWVCQIFNEQSTFFAIRILLRNKNHSYFEVIPLKQKPPLGCILHITCYVPYVWLRLRAAISCSDFSSRFHLILNETNSEHVAYYIHYTKYTHYTCTHYVSL